MRTVFDYSHSFSGGIMFRWLRGKPSCPIDPETKEHVENSFIWFEKEFGLEGMLSADTVVPTEEFLPLDYDCSVAGLQDLHLRITTLMRVERGLIELSFYDDTDPDGIHFSIDEPAFIKHDQQFEIFLNVYALEDPVCVVSDLAKLVSQVLLLGQGRISLEDELCEFLTDMLVIYLGMGVFLTNNSLFEYEGWSMEIYGYALAIYALSRGETEPDWTPYLHEDAKAFLIQSIRYITATSDCRFKPALQLL